jgi:MFS family permease
VILVVKANMSDEAFNAAWGGWRYPFWISILLVGISVYIRLKMKESPLFAKLKEEGGTSENPLKESFRHKANFKMVLLALFGAVMGQGVVWYTGQFYAQSFLETKCLVEFEQSRAILLWAIAFATPFFIFFGWLSDRIGRKWIMMAGMALAVFTYRPIFNTFLNDTHVDQYADNYREEKRTSIIDVSINSPDRVSRVTLTNGISFNEKQVNGGTVEDAPPQVTYSEKKLPPRIYWKFVGLVFLLILYVTMVYGPIAAFLVEMFPTRIRYTSMSLPYHIGNGVFGGLVPFIGVLLTTTYTRDPLVGLWYPIGVATLSLVIGMIYLSNRIDRNVND